MKKNIFVLLLLVSATAYGQGLIVKAGVNLATNRMRIGGEKVDLLGEKKFVPGTHIGMTYQIMVKNGFFIEPGLLYNLKGSKYSEREDGDYFKEITRINYLEVPVNFGYKYNFEKKNMAIYGYAGPYFAIAFGGKTIEKTKVDGSKEKQKEKLNFGSKDLSILDAGLNIGTGFEIERFKFGLQYGIGLNNMIGRDIRGEGDLKFKQSNRVLGISIGYRIGEDK
jgi:hypothetical protein